MTAGSIWVISPARYQLDAGVRVFKRNGPNNWSSLAVYQNGRGSGSVFPGNTTHTAATIAASLSAAPSRNTRGDFFLAWSDFWSPDPNLPNRTMLARMNGVTQGWAAQLLTVHPANVDVINREPQGRGENFRVGWSEDVALSYSAYGPVRFCSGNWTGAALLTTPSCTVIDTLGRDPQVLYYQSSSSGTQTRAMFDRMVAASPFALTPYQVPAALISSYTVGGLCSVGLRGAVHTFEVADPELAELGDRIADAPIGAPTQLSLFTTLEAADAALAAGKPAKVAQQLDILAKKVSAQAGHAIPTKVADALLRAIHQRRAMLLDEPFLAIANLHEEQTVQFLSGADASLPTAGIASELALLRFPWVVVFARNTGHFDLIQPPACPGCRPRLAPDASLDVAGIPWPNAHVGARRRPAGRWRARATTGGSSSPSTRRS